MARQASERDAGELEEPGFEIATAGLNRQMNGLEIGKDMVKPCYTKCSPLTECSFFLLILNI